MANNERPVRIKKFTIDRSKWLCGELQRRGVVEDNVSQLLDDQGRMCCLGFYAKACGLSKKDILDVPAYGSLNTRENAANKLPSVLCEFDALGVSDSDKAQGLMNLNDTEKHTAPTREKMLAAKFKEIGITVKFVGEYPEPEDDE